MCPQALQNGCRYAPRSESVLNCTRRSWVVHETKEDVGSFAKPKNHECKKFHVQQDNTGNEIRNLQRNRSAIASTGNYVVHMKVRLSGERQGCTWVILIQAAL